MIDVNIKIDCEKPELVAQAVEYDTRDGIVFNTEENKLSLSFTCENISTLKKVVYSTGNLIDVSMETIRRFK
ncbi:hypothetical protein A0H76_2676 [Hepatospora eriocheir]|uniref:Uncharacterized protein n=1 Tax=Hepatospora eriocheir TaxID=1081669 RepID=A0A1X0QJI6_9MICR|nr:hypothetical protein A0H76_2676 [Hepatospora eriocheir]